ncbi:uncharacterized protein LOC129235250 [Uloborus diversus]|uniref:uncharacterized protein LOC129235250 n=1 Tax=Uloborus diversus TaxID=327109 RepID=UPI00240A2C32|nr:uncharacterized protein LOC129235250 [Uloborus diversus]
MLVFFFALVVGLASAGHHGHNQSGMEKLLAAGLIAKALAKGGEEGGGGHHGGGHHYMPIPVPLASGGGGGGHHHHHVHHKYVPIPVKHHTNFIIAHHKVPVPVHIPVPVVKTKVVHVPVEKTKIVPIIVHKGGHHAHVGGESSYSGHQYSPSTLYAKKHSLKGSSSHLALATNARNKQVRITSLGTVRQIKNPESNATSIQFQKSSRIPDKWIVVVKNKRRPTIRRASSFEDELKTQFTGRQNSTILSR